MGLYDRDYMKGSDGRTHRPASADEQVEEFVSGFVRKHRRLLMVLGLVLVGLVLAGLVMAFV